MPEFRFLERLTVRPRMDAHMFKLAEPQVSSRSILDTARMFGLEARPRLGKVVEEPTAIRYTEGPFVVQMHRASGALRYFDQNRWQVDVGKAVTLEDREAIDIAREFVKKSHLVPLDDSEVHKVSRLRIGTLQRGASDSDERVIDVCVVFQRKHDGLPVLGPGGKAAVYIDHEGKVTGADKVWRGIGAVHTRIAASTLTPPDEADRLLERHWEFIEVPRIEVGRPKFGYFELGAERTQAHLETAYVYDVTLVKGNGQEAMRMHTVHVVPASPHPSGELTPPRKTRPREPVRT